MADRLDLSKLKRNMQQLKRDLPKEVGVTAQNFFSKSFDNQGFTDKGLELWQKSEKKKGATLVKSGRLKGAVNSSLKTTEWNNIGFKVSLPYAKIHNDGGKINKAAGVGIIRHRTDAKGNLLKQKGNSNLLVFAKGKHKRVRTSFVAFSAHSINMPQRKFIGSSRVLFDKINRVILKRLRFLNKG